MKLKNPSTSQDDKFIKPDPNRVSGIRKANYEKLNQKGYVNKETQIDSEDVIIGKVGPIQPGSGNNSKIYKDNSQIYKSGEKGVIDKVYLEFIQLMVMKCMQYKLDQKEHLELVINMHQDMDKVLLVLPFIF